MTALQFVSGLLGMLEIFCVDLKQGDIASLVFVVTFIADLLFYMMPMQAMLAEFILCDLLVAVLAQSRLGGFVEMLMAVHAFAFQFGMLLYDLAGYQHIAAGISLRLRDHAKKSSENRNPSMRHRRTIRFAHAICG